MNEIMLVCISICKNTSKGDYYVANEEAEERGTVTCYMYQADRHHWVMLLPTVLRVVFCGILVDSRIVLNGPSHSRPTLVKCLELYH